MSILSTLSILVGGVLLQVLKSSGGRRFCQSYLHISSNLSLGPPLGGKMLKVLKVFGIGVALITLL
jgi:hypothetical protein